MNSLTNTGEQKALTTPGLTAAITAVKLYTSASTPSKGGTEGVEFIQLANGNGYTTGGHTVNSGNWTYAVVSGAGRVTLADQTWTASGGNLNNIAGAYAVDGSGNVICWWERSTVTVLSGGSITLDDLYIGG